MHELQLVCPSEGWLKPAGQSIQLVDSKSFEYVPAEHTTQSADPFKGCRVPGLQGKQLALLVSF